MRKKGYDRRPEQVQTKVKQLKANYFHAKDAVEKSGASPEVAYDACPFDQLDAFLASYQNQAAFRTF